MKKLLFLSLLFAVLILNSCSSKPFPGFFGLKPGMNIKEFISTAKKNGLYLHSGDSFTVKFCDEFASVSPIFKGDKIKAIDIWFGYKKDPQKARDFIFKLKGCLTKLYGIPISRTISHPNFTVVHYYWKFKDAYVYVGVRIKHFKSYPRILIIRRD
ncbi:hypothetical protein TTHT_0951 [Thermotomaculum hydrothermale]|uniref:Lipoprotein n=1 Tax=Thermotomaculum hydrothermale TaxID=981385 RepID=A0A7R6SZ66_9BACT|nr:hypothetical protein [Thermotomaculum hydrothermale]BBB32505.1 hypothetical protein TTHT_0951 [Thermotomaculum hydrothermale]